MDNKAMYKLSYGLFVVTAKDGDKDNGCITNTAIQVTTEPNQIALAINKSNLTHDMVLKTGRLNISVISQDADFELFKRFGFQSGRDVDKFVGFSGMARAENGIYIIFNGTNAFISAEVDQTVSLSTHTLFICNVTNAEILSQTPSATYEYYQSSIKPAPPALKAESEGRTVWVCRICGYEYDPEKGDPEHGIPAGLDLDNLPEGYEFICPLCKHPASDFEKVIK